MTDMNVGVITTLWCVQPVFAALLDWLINKEPILTNHIIGMLFVIASGVAISLSGEAEPEVLEPVVVEKALVIFDPEFPKWVAVLFGLVTPMWMIGNSLWIKHLTQPSIGFDPLTNSFSSSFVASSIIIVIGAAWYWQQVEAFRGDLFLVGFLSSMLDVCGKACISKAFSRGPAGVVAALVEANNVILLIIESLRIGTFPNYI